MASNVETTRPEASASLVDRARDYVKEVRQEMTRVSWPTREELRDSTVVVIITVLLIAAFIGVVDRALTFLIGLLFR